MKTIWKFPLPLRVMSDGLAEIGRFDLKMPERATPLSVGVQTDTAMLWALIEPGESPVEMMTHHFLLIGTGKEAPEYTGEFIGTYQLGRFVGHVFYLGFGKD